MGPDGSSGYPAQPVETLSNWPDGALFKAVLIAATATTALAILIRTTGFDSEILARHQTILAALVASVAPAPSAAPRSAPALKSVAEAESSSPPSEAAADESPATPSTAAEATPAPIEPEAATPVEDAPASRVQWNQIQEAGTSTIMTQVNDWNPDGTINFESERPTQSVRDNGDTLTLTDASGARATFRVTATPGIRQCEASTYRITEPFPPHHGVVCVETTGR